MKEILDDRAIGLNMDTKSKDEVIRHLARPLRNAGYTEDLEGYVGDVYVRESEEITRVGEHVAVPHRKSDYVDHVGIAVGRTRDMINQESCDREPSRLFFLFATPAHGNGAKDHLHLIVELTGKLGNDNIMRRLQTAVSYDDLLEAFS